MFVRERECLRNVHLPKKKKKIRKENTTGTRMMAWWWELHCVYARDVTPTWIRSPSVAPNRTCLLLYITLVGHNTYCHKRNVVIFERNIFVLVRTRILNEKNGNILLRKQTKNNSKYTSRPLSAPPPMCYDCNGPRVTRPIQRGS